MELEGKIAIVTGASSGIGAATARLLHGRGVKLALVARSKGKLDALATELPGSIVIVADMTKVSDIEAMVYKTQSHFGRIDVLVNNAGQGYDAPIENVDADVFRRIFELDVLGPTVAMQRVIPFMRAQGGGAILNVSSGLVFFRMPGQGPYTALKRALVDLSLTARMELEKDNITVGVIYPYVTLTDFEKNTIKYDRRTGTHVTGQEPEPMQGLPHPADTAEHVAEKIVEALESGAAETFSHDWMKDMGSSS